MLRSYTNNDDMLDKFADALASKKYHAALCWFAKLNKMELTIKSDIDDDCKYSVDTNNFFKFKNMVLYLCKTTTPSNENIFKIINHAYTNRNNHYCNLFYQDLCKHRQYFQDWLVIEKKYIEYYNPDFHDEFLNLVDESCYDVAKYILQTKNINLAHTNLACFENVLSCCFIKKIKPDEHRELRVTPLQSLVHRMWRYIHNEKADDHLSNFLDLIRIAIQSKNNGLYLKDGKGKHIFHYLEELESRLRKAKNKFLPQVSNIILELRMRNVFTFFCSIHDQNANYHSMPKEIYGEVARAMMK